MGLMLVAVCVTFAASVQVQACESLDCNDDEDHHHYVSTSDIFFLSPETLDHIHDLITQNQLDPSLSLAELVEMFALIEYNLMRTIGDDNENYIQIDPSSWLCIFGHSFGFDQNLSITPVHIPVSEIIWGVGHFFFHSVNCHAEIRNLWVCVRDNCNAAFIEEFNSSQFRHVRCTPGDVW